MVVVQQALLTLMLLALTSCNFESVESKKTEETHKIIIKKQERPQIAILGMLHFVSKNNTVTQKFTEIRDEKRQEEIKQLVELLKKYRPTKIAVERPYRTQKKLNESYNNYVNGNYKLTDEETDQIGFRLAKELKHDKLYLVYSPVEFAFDSVMAYAKRNNQSNLIDIIIDNAKNLASNYDSIAENNSLTEAIFYLNSENIINKNHYGYLLLSQIGEKENKIGANAVGDWYKSNIKIFENIRQITSSPNDRVLVIYGQGHSKILNQLITDSPELELIQVNDFLR